MGIAGQGGRGRSCVSLGACALLALVAGPVTACGGDSDDDDGGADDGGDGGDGGEVQPCDLADADMVAAAFEGTVSPGEPGAARNCDFDITGGDVEAVDVYYFGEADDWDGVRTGYENNRGGTTDVSGIGAAAFFPNDTGPTELVVRTDAIIFAISVFVFFDDPPEGVEDDVAALAQAIIDAS
jgi:hypothetical protein